MIRALCIAALASAGWAQEPVAPDEWPVRLEWSVEPLRPYPGQPVDVVLRLGVPAEFAAEQLIPRFRQPLDLHLEIATPFGSEAWDGEPLGATPKAEGPRVALDGTRTRLRSRAGEVPTPEAPTAATRTELEHRTRWSFDEAGPRLLEPALVTGRWATSWRTDFLGQRTPADALDGRSASRAFSFDVRPFPAEGRPRSFVDAVGTFATRVELSTDAVEVGEVVTVAWTIAGEGNLARLSPPDFAGLEDFHLLGTQESAAAGERTVRADLRALNPRTTVFPPTPFASYDPARESYVDLTAAGPPLTVRGERALPKPARPDADPAVVEPSPAKGVRTRTALALAALAFALLLASRWALRHPRVRHARALARFESALARGEDPRGALARFAVERLDLGPYAPIDPRFETRLRERGARADTARGWAEWVRADLAADYGGPREGSAAPRDLARQLHRELTAAGRS